MLYKTIDVLGHDCDGITRLIYSKRISTILLDTLASHCTNSTVKRLNIDQSRLTYMFQLRNAKRPSYTGPIHRTSLFVVSLKIYQSFATQSWSELLRESSWPCIVHYETTLFDAAIRVTEACIMRHRIGRRMAVTRLEAVIASRASCFMRGDRNGMAGRVGDESNRVR